MQIKNMSLAYPQLGQFKIELVINICMPTLYIRLHMYLGTLFTLFRPMDIDLS